LWCEAKPVWPGGKAKRFPRTKLRYRSVLSLATIFGALGMNGRVKMQKNIAINVPAATLIRVLKRELGEAQILFLLAAGHAPDTPEAQILFEAQNKLLELEKAKGCRGSSNQKDR
jgi:hypothetical protein